MQRVLRIVNDDFSKLQYFLKRGWCIVDISAPGTSGTDTFMYALIEGPSMEELDFIHKNIDKWGLIKRGPVLVASGIHNQEDTTVVNSVNEAHISNSYPTNITESDFTVDKDDGEIHTVNPTGGTEGGQTLSASVEMLYGASEELQASAHIEYTNLDDAIFDPREIILSSYVSPRQHLYNISLLLNQINLQLSYQTSYMLSQTNSISKMTYTSAQEVAQASYQTNALNSYMTYLSYLTYMVNASKGLSTIADNSDNFQYLKNSSNAALVAQIEALGNDISDALKENADTQSETFSDKIGELSELLAGDGTTYNPGAIGELTLLLAGDGTAYNPGAIGELTKALTGTEIDNDGNTTFMGAIPAQTQAINELNENIVYFKADVSEAINATTNEITYLKEKTVEAINDNTNEITYLGNKTGDVKEAIDYNTDAINDLSDKLVGSVTEETPSDALGGALGTINASIQDTKTAVTTLQTSLINEDATGELQVIKTKLDSNTKSINDNIDALEDSITAKLDTSSGKTDGVQSVANSIYAQLQTIITNNNNDYQVLEQIKTNTDNISNINTTVSHIDGDANEIKTTVNAISEQIDDIELNPDFYTLKIDYYTGSSSTMGAISGGGRYLTGSSVTLIASAHDHYNFTNWVKVNSSSTEIISSSAVYNFTPSANSGDTLTYFAVFAAKPKYTLTVSFAAGSSDTMGSLGGDGQSVYADEYVIATAQPKTGYYVAGWYTNSAGTTADSRGSGSVFRGILNGNTTVYVKFVEDPNAIVKYKLTINAGDGGSSDTVDIYSNISNTVTVKPNDGYVLDTVFRSSGSGTVTNSNNGYNFTVTSVTSDITVTATFKKSSSSSAGSGGDSSGINAITTTISDSNYTQLNALYFDGNEIFDTGVTCQNGQTMYTNIYITEWSTSPNTTDNCRGGIYGSLFSGETAYWSAWASNTNNGNNWRRNGVTAGQLNLSINTNYNIIDTDSTVTINNTSYSRNNVGTFVSSHNVFIGGVCNNTTRNKFIGYIGITKLANNSTYYVWVPAKRKTDNAIGFYDTVVNTFTEISGVTESSHTF